jgi:hypothetical protein
MTMNNEIIKFIKQNWSLYIILLIDIFIEYNNSLILQKLNINDVYYKKIFDSLVLNFIYLLLPFYNIGLKIGQNMINNIEFTNMIKLQTIMSSFLSIFCYLSMSYYYDKMKISGFEYSIYIITFVITTNSLLGCLNGYLNGMNDNKTLIRFNIINLLSYFFCNKIIIYFNIVNENLLYIRSIPSLLCCIYILICYKNNFDYRFFFSHKINFIKCGFQLMIRNLITLFGLNINNYILFQLSKIQIKKYELISTKISNYINIYGPLSTIIQKKIYNSYKINKICIIYCVCSTIILNIINQYYWNFNLIIINLYNMLYFSVFINESKNITYNRINKSIVILLHIIICKYILYKTINITSVYEYYNYINLILFIKFLLNKYIS